MSFTVGVDLGTLPVFLFEEELVLALLSTVEFTFDTMPVLLLAELIVLDLSLTA
jgi:hypothetical protein